MAGSSVPLATHSATTEVAVRPTRRSSRWDVSHEYTENVKTEVKTEDSPERLTVSFKFHEDKMKRNASMLKKAHRDLAGAQSVASRRTRGPVDNYLIWGHCLACHK